MSANVAGNPEAPFYGIAAEFDTAGELFHAAEQMRDAGFTRFDVFSPFPIHGMDQAMGLKRSLLGKIVFVGGLIGFISAVAIQFVAELVYLSADRHGQADKSFHCAGFFSDHVRIHGAHLGLHRDLRNADDERPTASESPHV